MPGLRCWPECPSRPPPVVSGRASEPASAAWIDPVAVGRDGRRRRRSARVLERTSPRRGPRPSRTPTGSAARRARRWWPRDGRGVRRTAAIAPRALQLVRAAHDPRPCPATTSPRRRPSPSPSSSTSAARPLGPPRTRRGHDGRSGERTRLSPSRVRPAGGSPTLPEGSGCLWQTHRPPPAGAGSVVNRCGGGWSAMADAPSAPARSSSSSVEGGRSGPFGRMPGGPDGRSLGVVKLARDVRDGRLADRWRRVGEDRARHRRHAPGATRGRDATPAPGRCRVPVPPMSPRGESTRAPLIGPQRPAPGHAGSGASASPARQLLSRGYRGPFLGCKFHKSTYKANQLLECRGLKVPRAALCGLADPHHRILHRRKVRMHETLVLVSR